MKNAYDVLPLLYDHVKDNSVIFVFFFAFCIVFSFLAGAFVCSIILKFSFKSVLKKERADSVKRSRAVLGGQLDEQIAPYLPGFPCNPADVRFVGKPVDFVGFPGAATGNEISEVLIIEVKTGCSALSKREKEIKNCIENGKVRYVVYRPEINTYKE